MLGDELRGIREKLGELLGRLDPESANTLRRCRRNLEEAADRADQLENNLYPEEVA